MSIPTLLVALAALPLPEAVDFALARWPRDKPGVLAVAVTIRDRSPSRVDAEALRAELLGLVRGRALAAGLAEAVVALAPDDRVADRARAAGAEYLLLLELTGVPVDTLALRIVAVDPGGLWGPYPNSSDPPTVDRVRLPVAPTPAPAGSSSRGRPLTFFRAAAVVTRPLALAACRERQGAGRLVVLLADAVVIYPMRTRQLGEPKTVDLTLPVASESVRAPFGHAVCAPGEGGTVAVGHGRSPGGVVVEGTPPRPTRPLAGLPLATDGRAVVLGRPAGGTNVLESEVELWPPGDAPEVPEPSRAMVHDETTGWLFVTVRGPVVDTSGAEHVPRTGEAIATGGGIALVSAPEFDEGRDWVRLWDLRRQRWASAPFVFPGAVVALATDGELAFAAVETGGTYALYIAKLPPRETP